MGSVRGALTAGRGGRIVRSHMSATRVARIEKRIQQLVSQVLLHEMNDPRMRFVTVTGVKVASDLQTAEVRVTVLGSENDRRTCMQGLDGARVRIQSIVGGRLGIRRTPILTFAWDRAVEGSLRVAEIFRKLEKEREESGAPDPGERVEEVEKACDD